jgi:uncharacterized protein (TIGR00299 family) protein
MRVLYFDCFSGASGDMILSALLDAGASEEVVRTSLECLEPSGWSLSITETDRSGLRALRANVETVSDRSRTYSDILAVLDRDELPEGVRARASQAFRALAVAESRVHGTVVEEVRFHEVGALDAIVDIVGCCAALEDLAPEGIFCSPITTGRGTSRSEHGTIPVPGPAVTELLSGAELRVEGQGELLTPTGAALLATFVDTFGAPPPLRLLTSGYGAGRRDQGAGLPNVLRVLVGESTGIETLGDHFVIETNLDDMSPELIPYVIERLLSQGAHDAWTTPITMKKGRPAFTLCVLVSSAAFQGVLDTVYSETTTLGVRLRTVGKDELDREWRNVQVEGYTLRVKLGKRGGRVTTVSPEYADAVKVARVTGLPLKEVYARATREFGPLDESGSSGGEVSS